MKQKYEHLTLTTLFIGLTFFWTSSAYLSWTSHLSPLADETATYLATEVGGCLTQVIGIFVFMRLLKYDAKTALYGKLPVFAMILDGFTVLPVAFSNERIVVLIWGLVMNIFHGLIAGYYIAVLSYEIPKNRRALCFGVGYAFGNIASYLLSLCGGGNFLATRAVWFMYAGLILLGIVLFFYMQHTVIPAASATSGDGAASGSSASSVGSVSSGGSTHSGTSAVSGKAASGSPMKSGTLPAARITNDAIPASSCILAGAVVILLGLTTQLLFFFPAKAYISNTITLEFSHLFYAVGLLIAAFINDKRRNAGLVLALLSLCFPILSLSLYQISGMLTLLAVIGYGVMGFYTIYRIVVFTDLYDSDNRRLMLAPAGLLCGRIGEAAGSAFGYVIGSRHILLSVITAVLFIVSTLSVFLLYIRLYSEKPVTTAEDRAARFFSQYDLSAKEQQVFHFLIDGKSNKEIADELFISMNTVKFHVRNILKKTACEKRTDVVLKFQSYT